MRCTSPGTMVEPLLIESLCPNARSSERAAKQELHSLRTFIDDIGEGVGDLEVQIGGAGIAGPGVDRDFRNHQLMLHQETAEHRQTLEERTDAPLDHRLDALAADL